ncbi:MAG: DUF5020 family protein [Bacteroidaceae bacterium]|nr:DUF5020 family protein [Bacteroidaceae bacterium]
MKKFFAFAGLSLLAVGAFAQTNLQMFYDFGEYRKHVTTTLEMFKSDMWGDTFFFVDYDYTTKDQRDADLFGATGSYFEISRGINFWQDTQLAPLSLHAEFNGGVGFGSRNWLFGLNYFMHSEDFANTLTLEVMYKTFCGGASSDIPVQFTAVWGMNNLFGVEGLNFSGFADLWGENTSYWYGPGQDDPLAEAGKWIFISEPQLWYNVGSLFGCQNLNIGGEIELGYNFAGVKGFACNPCAGLKWNF